VVHTPPGYDPKKPSPVVLMFHGLYGSPQDLGPFTKMNPKADARGFLVVYPEGAGKSWNAGACCGDAASQKVDDVGFVRAILDHLEASYCVDPKRIFAAGMSNGGMMSHRLACELSDRIAAVGPVAGNIAFSPCNPGRPVPVMMTHGTSDSIVPYANDGFQGTKSSPKTFEEWSSRNGCTGQPTKVYEKGDATCVERSSCAQGSAVRFCTIADGGHQWPGGLEIPLLGKTSNNLDTSAELLSFFEAHPMP
jgi:polyhydroxybutyrate depolymerase